MKTLEQIKKIISNSKSTITSKFKVKEISVFGSRVRRENKTGSDIDILVDFYEPIGFFTFMDLEEYLGRKLGVKVDLVSRKALKPIIGKQILKEAVRI